MWYLIAILTYLVYSICIVGLFIHYDVPVDYQGWQRKFPNKNKRLLLFIFSGIIGQVVIGGSYVFSYMLNKPQKGLDSLYDWFKTE